MKRLLVLAAVLVSSSECCDPKHDVYIANEKNVQICIDRGGVPTVEVVSDNGAHQFTALKHCAFPLSLPMVER